MLSAWAASTPVLATRAGASEEITLHDTNGCLTEAVACDQQLGSVVKDRGSAVYELIRADKDGRNASGVFTAALRNDGTALVEARDGDFGADLTADLRCAVQRKIDAPGIGKGIT